MTYWEAFINTEEAYGHECDETLLEAYHKYLLDQGFVNSGPDNAIKKGDPNDRVS